jgi:hypothetical protein
MGEVLWLVGLVLGIGALASSSSPQSPPAIGADPECRRVVITDLVAARAQGYAMAKAIGVVGTMRGDEALLRLLPKLVPKCKSAPVDVELGAVGIEPWSELLTRASMFSWAELREAIDAWLREKAVI